MSKHTICSKAICPYYRAEGPQIIYCGVDITTMHRVFDNKSSAKAYKAHCCKNKYSDCPIYRMLSNDSGE